MAVIFCGIVMVGAADFFGDDGTGGVSNAIVGDIIVICAQVINSFNNIIMLQMTIIIRS